MAALGALLAAVAPARADEPASASDEELEVTVRGSTVSGYASRTSTDARAREPVDAASLLAELPSVHVRRLGADGAQSVLSIRGSASTQVGVLLAGIPLTGGADPSLDVGSLPLWPGASFRVHRGFAPASLGTTGYLGGLLVIEPPSPLTGARTETQVLAGSFGALKVRAGDVRAVGDLKLGTGVFASRSDGDFTYETTDPRTGSPVPRVRTNADALSAGAIARASLERTWGSVGATLFGDARRNGLPGSANFPTTFPHLETTRLVLGVDASIRAGKLGSFRAAAWGRREGARVEDPRGEIDLTRTSNLSAQSILAAGGGVGFRGAPLGPVSFGVFLDARGEHLAPTEGRSAIGGVEATRLAGGLGTEIEIRAASALRLFASGRIDGRRDRTSGVELADGAPSEELVPSGHLGATLRLSDFAVVSAHAGALRRFPSFVELYGDRGSLLGDPRLRTERALSADLGVHGDLGDGRVHFRYELVGFVTRAEDLIVFLPLGRSTFRAGNVDSALLGGAELSGALTARGLSLTATYTLLATENTSDDPLSRGRPLPGRPMHDLAYDAAYRIGPVRLRYGVDAVAGTTVDTASTIVVPSRIFHGAGASLDVPFVRGLRIGVEVQNLLDLRTLHVPSPLRRAPIAVPVSDFLGFPLPGRSIWVTARFRAP
ncbi:TonB-dependent receptor domain-containing protein [Polyangium aurulentum]|uniref:TonB-dependent receptor domain-containing protein n=1 Tax=Polyangium aurulentum TaxID=2567896 RepID=UPI00146D9391|nr:TonB-dependent receptor [Polyangium aurulentum]UQA60981.1 TonB-dependent receptor [Polyangium aurulentum]